MIKIILQVPVMGKEIDIECNEKAVINDVIEDALDILGQYWNISAQKSDKWILIDKTMNEIMHPLKSLEGHGVKDGHVLMLL